MYINYSKYSDSIALVILISKIEYSKCPEHFSPYFFYLNFLCIFFYKIFGGMVNPVVICIWSILIWVCLAYTFHFVRKVGV